MKICYFYFLFILVEKKIEKKLFYVIKLLLQNDCNNFNAVGFNKKRKRGEQLATIRY